MSSTYDLIITAGQLALDVASLEPEADIDGELAERLNAYLIGVDDKLGALRFVHTRFKNDADLIADEAKRLQARARTLRASAERVRGLATDLLIAHEETTGEAKVKTPEYTAWIATSRSVKGPKDGVDWPPEYQRTRIEPDKQGALRALRAGATIDGLEVVETRSIRWR